MSQFMPVFQLLDWGSSWWISRAVRSIRRAEVRAPELCPSVHASEGGATSREAPRASRSLLPPLGNRYVPLKDWITKSLAVSVVHLGVIFSVGILWWQYLGYGAD